MDLAIEPAMRLAVPVRLLRIADMTRLRLGANDPTLEYAVLGGEIAEEQRDAETVLPLLVTRLDAESLPVMAEVCPGFATRELLASAGTG